VEQTARRPEPLQAAPKRGVRLDVVENVVELLDDCLGVLGETSRDITVAAVRAAPSLK
jgi:hypothetical protein